MKVFAVAIIMMTCLLAGCQVNTNSDGNLTNLEQEAQEGQPDSSGSIDDTTTAPDSATETAGAKVTIYTLEEVSKHNARGDCWTVIDGNVVDITDYFGMHPNGDNSLQKSCGIDASQMFSGVKKHSPGGYSVLQKYIIGQI